MIRLQTIGAYTLYQTKKSHTKMLKMGKGTYAWVDFENIGEILVDSRGDYTAECTLSDGEYRIYDIDEEPNLNDNTHLELQVGRNKWQGYLLLTGLPSKDRQRTRMIPTNEIITDNPLFRDKVEVVEDMANVE